MFVIYKSPEWSKKMKVTAVYFIGEAEIKGNKIKFGNKTMSFYKEHLIKASPSDFKDAIERLKERTKKETTHENGSPEITMEEVLKILEEKYGVKADLVTAELAKDKDEIVFFNFIAVTL